jgi:hypothetical protein
MRAKEFISEQDYLSQIPTLVWKPVNRRVWNTIQDEGLDEEQDAMDPKQWVMASLSISDKDAESLRAFDDNAIEDFNRFDVNLKSRYPGLTDLIDYDHGTVVIVKTIDKNIERLDEVPLPPDWDPEQMNLRQTFKNRLKYALDRAKKLGGGSARVAMIIEYEGRPTALKVAKNLKGLAQNEAEINILDDGYLGNLPIIIPLIDYDKANKRPVWLQTEVAKKVNGLQLCKLLHTPSLWFLTDMVDVILGKPTPAYRTRRTVNEIEKLYFEPKMWIGDKAPTKQDWQQFSEYASEVADLVGQSSLETGDLQNPANWGVFNNRPVIIDLGFTGETKHLYGYKS